MLGASQFRVSLSPGCVFVLLPLDYTLHCIALNPAIYYGFRLLKHTVANIITYRTRRKLKIKNIIDSI